MRQKACVFMFEEILLFLQIIVPESRLCFPLNATHLNSASLAEESQYSAGPTEIVGPFVVNNLPLSNSQTRNIITSSKHYRDS